MRHPNCRGQMPVRVTSLSAVTKDANSNYIMHIDKKLKMLMRLATVFQDPHSKIFIPSMEMKYRVLFLILGVAGLGPVRDRATDVH